HPPLAAAEHVVIRQRQEVIPVALVPVAHHLRVLIAVAPERVRVEVAAEPEGAVAGLPRRRLLSLLLIDGVVRHDVAMLVPVFMSVAMRLPAVGVARQLPDGSEAREGDEYACGEGNHGMILRQ